MVRKKIVAGNWKMNHTLAEGEKLTSEIVNMVADEVHNGAQVVLAVPYLHIPGTARLLKGADGIALGAQNCHEEESGAFTGEISAGMLRSAAVEYVILGHSERRAYFGEKDVLISKKVDIALKEGLIPIYCCGETLDIRDQGNHLDFVAKQISEALFHLDAKTISGIVIAYEPVWAIGTGRTASPNQAQEMHEYLRKHLAGKYGKDAADSITILYGGSCKPDNAAEIFSGPDVDGGLIGGASLKSRDFVDIIKAL